jgi:hypothetical protein
MLLDDYDLQGRLFNVNFKEATRDASQMTYRGDLVLQAGDVIDDAGRRGTPNMLLTGAVMLFERDKIKFFAGWLNSLKDIQVLLDGYKADFAPDMRALLYVVDISKPLQIKADGAHFILVPLIDGLVWNELLDELNLQKSDFKGQSSGEKVRTVYESFLRYRPNYENVSLIEALTRTNNAKRLDRGPV